MAGQLWGTSTTGGYMYSNELSDVLRTQVRATAKMRQLCDAQDFSDKGLHKGQTVTWNVYSAINQNGTILTEGTAMPEAGFTVQQGTATVQEWGNSVPFTSLTDYYAAHSVTEVVRNVLARDARETLDRAAHAQFKQTLLRIVPTNGTSTSAITLTTNGTATGTNNVALGKNHIRAVADTMKERNIPPYAGDDYVAIARPTTYRQLRNDLESVNQYTETGYGKVLKGEIGRYEGMRFVEQTNVLSGRSNNGTGWTNGLSDWCFFMGADTVAEVMAVPPEIRGKIPTDYGRSLGMAWYALEGFGIVYQAGNDPGATNSRIVMWDSAA